MAQITYTRVQSIHFPAGKVRSNRGAITSFGDTLAWSLFLEGAARSRKNGVDITVVDIDGKVLVGDVGQLAE